MHDALSYLPKSIGTMVRWFGEIVAYFYGITTSVTVEGINNKLKLIKKLVQVGGNKPTISLQPETPKLKLFDF
jgi:Transposase